MSKRTMAAVVIGILTGASMPGWASAADLSVPPVRYGAGVRYCGCCGCLHTNYVYHRELRTTYGIGFDPRNYDTTEPHYYWGPVRAYPRYGVSGYPLQ